MSEEKQSTAETTSEEPINFPSVFPMDIDYLKFLNNKNMMAFSKNFMALFEQLSNQFHTTTCVTVLQTLYTVEKTAIHFNKLAPSDGGAMIADEIKRMIDGLEATVVNKANCKSIRADMEVMLTELKDCKGDIENVPGAKGYMARTMSGLFHILGFCKDDHDGEEGEGSDFSESSFRDAVRDMLMRVKKSMDDAKKGE